MALIKDFLEFVEKKGIRLAKEGTHIPWAVISSDEEEKLVDDFLEPIFNEKG